MIEQNRREHQAILDACVARDVDGAETGIARSPGWCVPADHRDDDLEAAQSSRQKETVLKVTLRRDRGGRGDHRWRSGHRCGAGDGDHVVRRDCGGVRRGAAGRGCVRVRRGGCGGPGSCGPCGRRSGLAVRADRRTGRRCGSAAAVARSGARPGGVDPHAAGEPRRRGVGVSGRRTAHGRAAVGVGGRVHLRDGVDGVPGRSGVRDEQGRRWSPSRSRSRRRWRRTGCG